MNDLIHDIARQLDAGAVIPYLGPDMLSLCGDVQVPATSLALAEIMTSKVSVPHKIRKRLTQAAQFIENFKHRKSVVQLMNEAFASVPAPSALHLALARSGAGLWVDTWYDDTPTAAAVQRWRIGRHFLFLGCRFDDQLTRSFARQIMKRSSDHHWAVLPEEPTRMEARFLEEQGITRIPMALADFSASLIEALQPALAA